MIILLSCKVTTVSAVLRFLQQKATRREAEWTRGKNYTYSLLLIEQELGPRTKRRMSTDPSKKFFWICRAPSSCSLGRADIFKRALPLWQDQHQIYREERENVRLFKIQQGADKLSIYVQTEKFIALKQSGWTQSTTKI